MWSEPLTEVYSWAKSKSLFHNKALNILCILLTNVPKVKNRWLCGWMTVSILVVYPCDSMADLEPWLPDTAQYCISLAPEKMKNSKFKVCSLLNAHCFCSIIKPKNHKLNHSQLGTSIWSFNHLVGDHTLLVL